METPKREIVDIVGPCAKMVGNQHHETAVPAISFLEPFDKATDTVIAISKGIEFLVAQPMEGHIERLMRAGSLNDAEGGAGAVAFGEVFLDSLKHQVVGYSPFTESVGHGKVMGLSKIHKSLIDKERAHVGEIRVTAIIVMCRIAMLHQLRGQ